MPYKSNTGHSNTTSTMPQIHPEIPPLQNVEIYFWHIEENAEELAAQSQTCNRLLPEARERFKAPKRLREWLAVRALLELTPYGNCSIVYRANGQPVLDGCNKHISISHTHGYAAIAFADKPIGIDIESKKRNALALATAFLQTKEIDTLQPNGNEKTEALRLWTAKEAAFKCFPDKSTVLKDITTQPLDGNSPFMQHLATYRDCTTAICRTVELKEFIISVCTTE